MICGSDHLFFFGIPIAGFRNGYLAKIREHEVGATRWAPVVVARGGHGARARARRRPAGGQSVSSASAKNQSSEELIFDHSKKKKFGDGKKIRNLEIEPFEGRQAP